MTDAVVVDPTISEQGPGVVDERVDVVVGRELLAGSSHCGEIAHVGAHDLMIAVSRRRQ